MATTKTKPGISAVREAKDWSPTSWQTRPHEQQPVYPDATELDRALKQLHELPPLVTSWEILALKNLIADAAEGRRFLLQGGDCAESFDDCTSPLISNRLKVMLQMSLVLVHGLKLPVVRVGRFAGQYAKPRSADVEVRGWIEAHQATDKGFGSGLGKMPRHRLGHAARATLAERHLDRGIAVAIGRLDLGHAIVGHVHNRYRDGIAFVGKQPCHANLAADKS